MATDPVNGYAQDVIAGKIVVGRLVRLACERHLRDAEAADRDNWAAAEALALPS
jgi:hypothetical protein